MWHTALAAAGDGPSSDTISGCDTGAGAETGGSKSATACTTWGCVGTSEGPLLFRIAVRAIASTCLSSVSVTHATVVVEIVQTATKRSVLCTVHNAACHNGC